MAVDTPLPKPTVISAPVPHASDVALGSYVRRSVWQAIAFIVLLVGGIGILGAVYEEQLLSFTNAVFETVGLAGLLGILFVSDSIFSPVPPDLVLLVLSRTHHHEHWPWLVGLIGVLSVVAGWVGWVLGRWLGNTRFGHFVLKRSRAQNEALVRRHGGWAVALGAITPIPFSITCWFAGMYRMKFAPFARATLLRIPRFFVYYFAIAYGDRVVRALWP